MWLPRARLAIFALVLLSIPRPQCPPRPAIPLSLQRLGTRLNAGWESSSRHELRARAPRWKHSGRGLGEGVVLPDPSLRLNLPIGILVHARRGLRSAGPQLPASTHLDHSRELPRE